MSDLIRREDAIAAVDFWEGDWSCTVLALMALPAVQPDAARILDLLRAALGDGMTMQQFNEARALLNTTGKDVMPDDAVQPDAGLKPFDCECGQVGPCKAQFCTPRSAQRSC